MKATVRLALLGALTLPALAASRVARGAEVEGPVVRPQLYTSSILRELV